MKSPTLSTTTFNLAIVGPCPAPSESLEPSSCTVLPHGSLKLQVISIEGMKGRLTPKWTRTFGSKCETHELGSKTPHCSRSDVHSRRTIVGGWVPVRTYSRETAGRSTHRTGEYEDLLPDHNVVDRQCNPFHSSVAAEPLWQVGNSSASRGALGQ